MRCVANAFVAVCLMVPHDALPDEVSDRFTIKGEYLTAEQSTSNRTPEEGMMDVSQLSVSINKKKFSENGQIHTVELATGRFVDRKITLESQIDAPTEVQIVVQTGTDQRLQAEALILPGDAEMAFALVDREGLETDQLLLVGESKRAKDHSRKFSISGVYDLEDAVEAPGHLSASLTSFEYHRDGTPNLIEFGMVLLANGSYLIEVDVDEPRVGNLTITRGSDFVWSSPVVMEPGGEVSVARRGTGNWLIANSEGGRHAKLYDSWHMSEDFLRKGQAMVSAPVGERGSLLQELDEMRMKALVDIAMNLEEPFNSLIALELARERYFPDSVFPDSDKLELYDKLATMLDEDVVARRITYPRDRLAKHLARTANNARLFKGKLAPEFTLDNLNGETVSLKNVLGERVLVLVEFWASWCAPCIAKIPSLKSLYTMYRDAGFEIVTISLDTRKEDWKQSSKELNIPWFDLGDMKAFSGSTAVAYGVGNVPANYLIDGDRRIVAKNVVVEEIEELLDARFGPDPNVPTTDLLESGSGG